MKTSTLIYTIIGIVILLGAAWMAYDRMEPTATGEVATSTSQNGATGSTTPNGQTGEAQTGGTSSGTTPRSTYANATYGFEIEYPSYVRTQNDFTVFHNLGNKWRVNSSTASQGKNIVSFPVYRVDQGGVATGKPYPLFFTAEVRVGVSNDVANCYATDAGYTNQTVTNVTINGVAFKKFDFADAAMQQYVQGSSYRTIHNNQCFAVEQIKTGSNYRDDTMTPGLSDTTLTSYYTTAGDIVRTFKFTK